MRPVLFIPQGFVKKNGSSRAAACGIVIIERIKGSDQFSNRLIDRAFLALVRFREEILLVLLKNVHAMGKNTGKYKY